MCKTTHMKVTGEKLNACFLEYPQSIENKLIKIISVSVSKPNVRLIMIKHDFHCILLPKRYQAPRREDSNGPPAQP